MYSSIFRSSDRAEQTVSFLCAVERKAEGADTDVFTGYNKVKAMLPISNLKELPAMKPISSLNLLLICLLSACQTTQQPLANPSPTPSPTPSPLPTTVQASPLPSPSATVSATPSPEPTEFPTVLPMPSSVPQVASTPRPTPTPKPSIPPDPIELNKLNITIQTYLSAVNQQDLNGLTQTLSNNNVYSNQVKAMGNTYFNKFPYPLPLKFIGFSSLSSLNATTRNVIAGADLYNNNKSYPIKLGFIKVNDNWLIDTIYMPKTISAPSP